MAGKYRIFRRSLLTANMLLVITGCLSACTNGVSQSNHIYTSTEPTASTFIPGNTTYVFPTKIEPTPTREASPMFSQSLYW